MRKNRTIPIERAKGYIYQVDVSTDKSIDRTIKNIETIIRSSPEYRDYIKFLKENVDMDKCAFFNNVSSNNSSKVKIEVHHEPLTLYDYVSVVLNKHISEKSGMVNEYEVAEEVMELHYKDLVGLIPLSVTLHEMVHSSDKVKIPLHLVYGDYVSFINQYSDYVDNKIIEKLDRKISDTKLLSEKSFDDISINFSYLDVDGFKLPTMINDDEENDVDIEEHSAEAS